MLPIQDKEGSGGGGSSSVARTVIHEPQGQWVDSRFILNKTLKTCSSADMYFPAAVQHFPQVDQKSMSLLLFIYGQYGEKDWLVTNFSHENT